MYVVCTYTFWIFSSQLFGNVIELDGCMNINNGATAVLLSSSLKTSNRNFKHSLSTLTLEIDVCVDFVVQIFEKLPAMICGSTST